jgi:hypothetical protein
MPDTFLLFSIAGQILGEESFLVKRRRGIVDIVIGPSGLTRRSLSGTIGAIESRAGGGGELVRGMP